MPNYVVLQVILKEKLSEQVTKTYQNLKKI